MPRREKKTLATATGTRVVIEITMPNGRTFPKTFTGVSAQTAMNLAQKDFPRATVKVAHTRG